MSPAKPKPPAALPPVLLTEESVANASLPTGATQVVVRDTKLKGFMLVISAGKKTFAIQRHLRVDKGIKRTVRMTVLEKDGSRPKTVKKARTLARALLLEIENGRDPRQHRPNDPTLKDAWDHYVADMRERGCKEGSIKETAAMLDRHFADWKATPLRSLGRQPQLLIERRDKLNKKGNSGYAGAKPMRNFSSMYDVYRRTHAWLDLPVNPLTGHRLGDPSDVDVSDHLTPAQMRDWMRRWRTIDDPVMQRFHLVSFFTGMRPGALCAARVENLYLDRGFLIFRDAEMKNDTEFDLPLSAHLIDMLKPATNGEWLFPWPANASGHVDEYDSPELKMKGHAGEPHCWAGYWLRRNYATHAEAATGSRDAVSRLLHHKRGGVTGRYVDDAAMLGMMRTLQEQVTAYLLKTSQ